MSLKSSFSPTLARRMVDKLNNGLSPTSFRARTYFLSTGQFRGALAWTFLAVAVAWLLYWLTAPVLTAPVVRGGSVLHISCWVFGIAADVLIGSHALSRVSALFGPLGPARWARPLQANPEHCKELVLLANGLGSDLVAAVNRPLYIADLVLAKQLAKEQVRQIRADEYKAYQEAYANKLAEYCSRAHSLVKTEAR